ncbi:MAG TPA: 2-hydroxyacyl-CoA dehydratase family protein [Candidatus Anoxymicrobiaceae bacterium]
MGTVEMLAERFRSTISPELLKTRRFWAAISALTRAQFGPARKNPDAAALQQTIDNTRDAFLGHGPVAWASLLIPTELLHGAGVVGFYPEVAAAVLTTGRFSERFLQRASADGFSSDLCSFHRVVLGASAEGFLPRPDVILSASSPCDSAPMSFAHLADFHGVEHIALEFPACEPTSGGTGILARQIADTFERLLEMEGTGSEAKLRSVVELSNEAGAYAREVEELRRLSPCPLDGWDALGQLAVIHTLPGTRECVEFYRLLADELRRGKANRAPERQDHRLLWMHLKPYFATSMPRFLEEKGAVIVCEEYNRWFWPEMDPGRPFDSMAVKMMSHPAVGPASRRAEIMIRLAREYRVDGAVHFSHRGCRQSSGCARQLRDELAAAGIRTLVLDGECLDEREHNEGQVRTRLEAFLESLDG